MNQDHVLELNTITVRFGDAEILHDINLYVTHGEILGILGANGAGKSTMLRCMMGLIEPERGGMVRVFGVDLARPEAMQLRQRIGFVPDPDGLDPRLQALRHLDELAALSGIAPHDRAEICDALELRPSDLRRRIGQLSRGTRQKVALVQGLQHRPDLVVLDEPSDGLDPFARQGLMHVLVKARQRGAGIVFSSHVLSDVETLCDRVAMLRTGHLLTVARLAELRQQLARQVMLITSSNQTLTMPTSASDIEQHDNEWRFVWHGEVAPLLAWLAHQPIQDVTITPPTLANVFDALSKR
ncbi:MAG: ABC transporter ATP-binding protein [Herpetosiphon sp.]|nr:ABC transporter ATP-binding protein [Herpetosiphon sp.]